MFTNHARQQVKIGLFAPYRLPVWAGAWLALAGAAQAQTYDVLHSFGNGADDGTGPYGSLIQSGNTLYGMTKYGGSDGMGTLFGLDTADGTQTILHSFAGGAGDGANPSGSLIQSGNMLYGMTYAGGSNNDGTLFAFNTGNNTQSVLHPFAGGSSDGAQPWGSLIQSGNTLYAMTGAGGSKQDGILVAYNLGNNTQSLLHTFAGGAADGAHPWGSLIQSGNTVYGMSYFGGAHNSGALFAFNTGTRSQTVLHSFAGGAGDGANPFGSLVQSGSTLYGMTYFGGGSNQGALFAFDTSTGTQSTLYSFSGSAADGSRPWGSLIESGSMLYGMTYEGGSNNQGAVFALDTRTDSFSILHSFAGTDGAYPSGDLLLSDNTLYGMTYGGGDNGQGVIFSLSLNSVPEPTGAWLMVLPVAGWLGRRKKRQMNIEY